MNTVNSWLVMAWCICSISFCGDSNLTVAEQRVTSILQEYLYISFIWLFYKKITVVFFTQFYFSW
jgi:hypothetical protein